ncbi:MAG: TatD family nuclease-associated radical SAM protein [Endomicrobia bacterium]|nr:TatD family nuclease-associated radical SAM protein [Endomicrobiia bacterium]MCX7716535.1 TatD family nuclease-associated radical SAM protein [Endomicrobiia bacterium]
MKSDIVYKYKEALYINVTNRCPVKCLYCIKYSWKFKFRGYYLGLNREPTKKQIISILKKQIKLYPEIKEIVFCGYGEPLLRPRLVREVSEWVKDYIPTVKIRINTNGLANAYHKKNILPMFKGIVDSVSISLNADSEEFYAKFHKTTIVYPFRQIINFIKQAKKYFSEVVVTTIEHPQLDVNKVKKIAKKLGVKFKLRPYLIKYEQK